jgi:hypothetical protein
MMLTNKTRISLVVDDRGDDHPVKHQIPDSIKFLFPYNAANAPIYRKKRTRIIGLQKSGV